MNLFDFNLFLKLQKKIYLLVTFTGWYRTKRAIYCGDLLIYYAPHLSSNHFRFIYQSCLENITRHLVGKQGEFGKKCPLI
jgi:hypothetical protein